MREEIKNWYQEHKKEIVTFLKYVAHVSEVPLKLLIKTTGDDKVLTVENNLDHLLQYKKALIKPLIYEFNNNYNDFFTKIKLNEKFQKVQTLEQGINFFSGKAYEKESNRIYNEVLSLIKEVGKKLDQIVDQKQIGKKYLLEELLGKGGEGEVYKATNLILGKPNALKLIRSDLMHSIEGIEAIKEEYQRRVEYLIHPAIVQYRDIDYCAEEKKWFIVMDYIDGKPLREIINKREKRAFKIKEVYDTLLPVAEALTYAHTKNIIHTDLKPENILCVKPNLSYLSDFGFSCEIENSFFSYADIKHSTRGTPQYMSPEQCKGKQLKQSTDVWSLSIIIYEMLSLKRPFSGSSNMEIMRSVCEDEPIPIKDFSRWEILQQGLNKSSKNRIQSPERLLNLLYFGKEEIIIGTDKYRVDLGGEDILNKAKTYYTNSKFKEAFDIFIKNQENSSACYYLAKMYTKGESVPKDYNKAVSFLEKGIQNDHSDCLVELGNLYLDGKGVKQSFRKALSIYKKAAKLKNTLSMRQIGKLYESGKGVKINYEKALNWYNKALKLNNFMAYCDIGRIHELGLGVTACSEKALYYYKLAIEHGETEGMLRAANIYLCGVGKVKKNIPISLDYLRQAAELNDTNALKELASIHLNPKTTFYDKSLGIHYYESAIALHDLESMSLLSIFYIQECLELFDNENVSDLEDPYREVIQQIIRRKHTDVDEICSEKWQDDMNKQSNVQAQMELFEKGVFWLFKATEYYDTNAMLKLGQIYEEMNEVEDMEYWYEQAISYNNMDAAMLLADYYVNVSNEEEYGKKIITYYEKAAREGIYEAAHKLGELYAEGRYVKKSITKAKKWYLFSLYNNVFREEEDETCFADTYEKVGKLYFNLDIQLDNNLESYLETNIRNVTTKKMYEGLKWYKKSLEHQNYDLYYKLGRLHKEYAIDKDSDKIALNYYLKYIEYCADENSLEVRIVDAYNEIAEIYEKFPSEKEMINKAIGYYEKTQNYNRIGMLYHYGKGVQKNLQKAVTYYEDSCSLEGMLNIAKIQHEMYGENSEQFKEALQEAISEYEYDQEANIKIAQMYEYGDGIPKSVQKAIEYYRDAADEDNVEACINLARLYKTGLGGNKSKELSEYYESKVEELQGDLEDYFDEELY